MARTVHAISRFITFLFILLSAGAIAPSPDDPPAPPVWPGRFHAMISQVKDEDYGVVDLWYDYAEGRNLNIVQTQSGEEDGPLFDNEQANGTTYYYNPAKAKAKYCTVVDFGVGIIRPDWLKDATYLGEEECGIYQCNKWEQGEIPEAHARLLGLRTANMDSPSLSSHRAAATAARKQDKSSRYFAADQEDEEALSASGSAVTRPRKLDAEEEEPEGFSRRGAGEAKDQGNGERREGDRFITYWSEKVTDRPVKWVFFDDAKFQVIRFDEGATMPEAVFQIPAYCFEDQAE